MERSGYCRIYRKNGIGFAVNSLAEIDDVLGNMTRKEYEKYRNNVLEITRDVRKGEYVKSIYRSDFHFRGGARFRRSNAKRLEEIDMQNTRKSLKINFIMNVILSMSAFLFPLITFPYVSRILKPEGMGKISFATSLITYFLI